MAKLQKGDTEKMTLVQKGEILYLDSIGKTKKQIAKITGRSMEWIETINGALAGTDIREELIAKHKKTMPAPKPIEEPETCNAAE